MFTFEIISLLNKYDNSDNLNEKNQIREKIIVLISENLEAFKRFVESSSLLPQREEFLQKCYEEIQSHSNFEGLKKEESNNDLTNIKNAYLKWLDFYNKNNKLVNLECEDVILHIINFYISSKFEVLTQVLTIEDSEDFENFKGMLKNYIRAYFAKKILNYYNGESFESLGFFEKRAERKRILKVLDDIGEYKFNHKEIFEVLK